MSYQKDRDEFVGVIVEECGTESAKKVYRRNVPAGERRGSAVEMARAILRDSSTLQRLAVEECNRELTPREVCQIGAARERIEEACKPWGIKPHFHGDPRGACVKMLLPSGRWNSMGGAEDGYCVPTR
jgi:hypothetical protein